MSHHVLKRESALQAACHSTCTVCGMYTQKTATQSMSYTGAVDALLVTLEPDTDYYFRAKAVGDGTGYGEEQSFTTHGSAPAPDLVPSIAGVQWTDPWNRWYRVLWAITNQGTTASAASTVLLVIDGTVELLESESNVESSLYVATFGTVGVLGTAPP